MKSFLILLTLTASLMSISAFANNDQCLNSYRDGLNDLVEKSEEFNRGKLDSTEFAKEVALISTAVTSKRAVCYAIEDPGIRKCVEVYKRGYKKQRDQISVLSVLAGIQTRVKIKRIDNALNMVDGAVRGCLL